MLIVREVVINTGSMTFESDMDFTNFVISTPTTKKMVDTITRAQQLGYVIDRKLIREEPNLFRLKTTYTNEENSRYVQENVSPHAESIIAVVNALGWTAEKFVSYIYD